MLKEKLAICLREAALKAQQQGSLTATTLPEVAVERPQDPEYGDFAPSLPLKLARSMSIFICYCPYNIRF